MLRRVFGAKRCTRCLASISPTELVMRVRNLVFHINCFSCAVCNLPLTKGDQFGVKDAVIYCRLVLFFPQIYSRLKWKLMIVGKLVRNENTDYTLWSFTSDCFLWFLFRGDLGKISRFKKWTWNYRNYIFKMNYSTFF